MNYLKSALMIGAVSLLGSILLHTIAPTNLAMLYILVVVITAMRWGKRPALFASVLSVLVFDFFFVPPKYSLTVAHVQYLIVFATLFTVGMVVSTLALRAKEQAEAARDREAQTQALYNLSKDLVQASDLEKLDDFVRDHFRRTFGAEAKIVLGPGEEGKAVSGQAHRLPLKTTGEPFGTIRVTFDRDDALATPGQRRLLEAFVNQIAFAIERRRLSEEAAQAKLLRETEKLQTAFLNSVSHDLRTPLASISGSLSVLLENPEIDNRDRRTLIETAAEEAHRLNQLVGELLDMARVEAGALKIVLRPVEVEDLIQTTLESMSKTLSGFEVTAAIPPDLPEVGIDFPLMVRVLANILDNAVKYSGDGRTIEITAEHGPDHVEIRIADRGVGIPSADLGQVFDKFHRVKRPQGREGTGLGLSVCKGIVEAHGGWIRAENREGGGTVIRMTLPARLGNSDG